MKRYLIYILLIISSICYGQIYSTTNSNIQYNNFRSTSYYSQPIREYNNYDSYENYNDSKFGYTMQKYGYSTYKGSYTPNYSSNYESKPNPKKSKERPDPYENIADWWRMNLPNWLGGDEDWPRHVNSDYWDWFLENYGDEYGWYVKEWFERHPGFPNDPFATPIGEFPISLLLILSFGYLIYKNKKKINIKRTMSK